MWLCDILAGCFMCCIGMLSRRVFSICVCSCTCFDARSRKASSRAPSCICIFSSCIYIFPIMCMRFPLSFIYRFPPHVYVFSHPVYTPSLLCTCVFPYRLYIRFPIMYMRFPHHFDICVPPYVHAFSPSCRSVFPTMHMRFPNHVEAFSQSSTCVFPIV